MSEHLSALELDEVAAELVAAPAHLASCAECAKRLASLQAQRAAFLARPEAKVQLQALAPAPPRRAVLRLVGLALAAGLAVVVAWPRAAPEDRVKGAPEVVLLDASGQVVTRATAGQRLTLAVGAAGAKSVRVFATDAQGKHETLFDGPVASGARVPLTELEVTPGDVHVTAQFDDGRTATVRLEVPK